MAQWRSAADRVHGTPAELSLWLNNEQVEPTAEHVVDRYLQLLRPLGRRNDRGAVRVAAARPCGHRRVDSQHTAIRRLCGAQSGCRLGLEALAGATFRPVGAGLGECHRLPSVVTWAGDRERASAQEIVARAGGHAWLAPPTTLPELATLMSRARLCVAGDTGPLHLAAAVGTPCVGLFGPNQPALRRLRASASPCAGVFSDGHQPAATPGGQ